jgi:hypothetical protein
MQIAVMEGQNTAAAGKIRILYFCTIQIQIRNQQKCNGNMSYEADSTRVLISSMQ